MLIARLFPSSAFARAEPSVVSDALRCPFITVQKVRHPAVLNRFLVLLLGVAPPVSQRSMTPPQRLLKAMQWLLPPHLAALFSNAGLRASAMQASCIPRAACRGHVT